MMLDAKIGGITPAMFSLNGRCVDWPCIQAAALLALRVMHGDPSLRLAP